VLDEVYEASINYGTGSVSHRTHLTCCFTSDPPNDLRPKCSANLAEEQKLEPY
jgi:hypothetical protein